jgi:large subunit ribosomal protein L29
MAIFRVGEIRKMSKEERGKKLSELKVELSKMMAMKAMGGSLENPSRIHLLRKAIAKFHTVKREEELGINKVERSVKAEKRQKKVKADEKEDAEE